MSRRLFVVSLCTIAAVALAAPAAQASAPYVTHYKDLPAVYTDNSLCQNFGSYAFDVTVNGSDHVTIREYDTKTVFVDRFRGIVTGPTGKQLVKFEDAVITDDATGNETWTGVAEGYAFPDGKNLARDNGEIVFDPAGNIISENGPHPIADGPGRAAVCEALKP